MELKEYLKEKLIFLVIQLMIVSFTITLLKALNVNTYAAFFIAILSFIGSIVFYIYDYFIKRKYYNNIYKLLDSLDKKYLISDIKEDATFLEGKILDDILYQTDKAMNDKISEFINTNKEYREYIELWVHEIKTPIAAAKLLIENNRSMITNSIEEEIDKVESFIQQTLFYAKSTELEKDYIIKKYNTKEIINGVIKKNAGILIQNKIKVNIENSDQYVYSDCKWIEFILNQIISNSIKYMKGKEKILNIYCENNNDNVIVNIKDNGIGMNEKSLKRVFEKGFTGENGRKFSESTGIGLYLCKKLCNKLGLNIKVQSKENEGTIVSILFPKNNMILLEN